MIGASALRIRTGGALASPVLALALLLGGCGEDSGDPGPGGVTVGEARALDEAAQMLDERRLPEGVLEREAPANTEEGVPPETR